ncbi:MAG: two-component regulator propeller domain-containing protein [Bacteroidales bacterium]
MKKLIKPTLLLLSMATLISCEKNEPFINATKLEITSEKNTLIVDSTTTINPIIIPSNSTDTAIIWSTSNNAIATIDSDGNLKANAPGKVKITATTKKGKLYAEQEIIVVRWVSRTFGNQTNMEVNAILPDAQGNLWICSNDVYKIDMAGAWQVSNQNLQPSSILQDKNGQIWIGTQNGIQKFDGTIWESYNSANSGLKDNSVITMVSDQNGNILASHYSRQSLLGTGVSEFDGKNWKYYSSQDGLTYDNVVSMATDKQGTKWFVTTKGISAFDGHKWQTYNQTNVSNQLVQYAYLVAIDNQNNKWFGTNFGLLKFDGTNWTEFTNQNSGMIGGSVTSIEFDKENNLWVSTGAGVAKYNGEEWTRFTRDYHPLQDVRVIKADRSGKIYIGTGKGLLELQQD